jgi:hypothetical protein
MLHTRFALAAIIVLIASLVVRVDAAPATTRASATTTSSTQPTETTLQVLSLRIARSASNTQQLQKRFGQRFYNDNPPGVTAQMVMTLGSGDGNGAGNGAGGGGAGGTFLPPAREAILLDTFVDDTYENLLLGPVENRTFMQPPAVSPDGRQLLFTVMSARAPADDAGRVYVRGAIQARLARGNQIVSKAQLRLRAGEQVEVGPTRVTLKSISEAEQNIALTLTVRSDDAAPVRRLRLLSKDGRRLNMAPGDREERVESAPGMADPQTFFNAVVPAGHEEVTIELTHAERVENVRIPFEAQFDIAHTKIGPIQSLDRRGGGGRGVAGANAAGGGEVKNARERPWPPPPLQPGAPSFELSPRSGEKFDLAAGPTTAPTVKAKLDRATVDLFALTLSKPPPGEVEGVTWNNPPPRAFAASGYTLARLMLSTPDVSIASVAQDGIEITRFEDDKGKLDATIYRDTANRFNDRAIISPDGQQALLHVTLAAAPRPGATRCTLAGTVKAKVAIRERTDAAEPVDLKKGERAKAGPITVHFADVRQDAMISPVINGRTPYHISLSVNGPLNTVRSIEVVSADSGRRLVSKNMFENYDENRVLYGNSMSFSVSFFEPPPEKVIVRVRHFEKLDTVTVPFEVTTGIGL